MSKNFVYITDIGDHYNLKQYAGELLVSTKDGYVDIYKRNDKPLQDDNSRNVCRYCGNLSDKFLPLYRDNNGCISRYCVCLGCFNLTDEEFEAEDKSIGHQNLVDWFLEFNETYTGERKYNLTPVDHKAIEEERAKAKKEREEYLDSLPEGEYPY